MSLSREAFETAIATVMPDASTRRMERGIWVCVRTYAEVDAVMSMAQRNGLRIPEEGVNDLVAPDGAVYLAVRVYGFARGGAQ